MLCVVLCCGLCVPPTHISASQGDDSIKWGKHLYHELKEIYVTSESLHAKLKPLNSDEPCNEDLMKAIAAHTPSQNIFPSMFFFVFCFCFFASRFAGDGGSMQRQATGPTPYDYVDLCQHPHE